MENAPLEGGSFDVVFVIDNSESMLESDPDRISFMAAQLFTDLFSGSNSRMGYVGFSDKVKDKRPIQKIAGNKGFRNFLSNADDFGGGTNIGLGLSEADNLFSNVKKSEYNNKKALILLGDGNNWPTPNKTVSELDKDTESWATKIKDKGILLYAIGLNYDKSLNVDFMKKLPNNSNMFFEATTASEIPSIMGQIYMNLFNGGLKHLGAFDGTGKSKELKVDLSKDMYEANLIFVTQQSIVKDIQLINPNGDNYPIHNTAEDKHYSCIRLNFPDTGKWILKYNANKNDKVFIDLISIYDVPDYATVSVFFETNSDTVIYPESVKYGDTVTAPQTPIKTDYIFNGWFTDAECENAFDFNSSIKDELTLYAKWVMEVPGVYTVSFDMNGGVFLNPRPVIADGKVEVPEKSSCRKIGYDFAGFYLDKQTTTPFDPDTPISDNLTLYAKWVVVECNVIPVIIMFLITGIVLFFAIIIFPKMLVANRGKINSPFIKSAFALLINALMCVSVYMLFYSYLIPKVFHFTVPLQDALKLNFKDIYIMYFIISGIVLSFIFNLLFTYVIPSSTNLLRDYKKRQYKKGLFFSLIGIVFALLISLPFGIGLVNIIWFIILYGLTYTVNYFVSSLAVSSAMSKGFSLWG